LELDRGFPQGLRIGILGSSRILGLDSEEICIRLGTALASIPHAIVLTGGVSGIAPAVGRAFFKACLGLSIKPNVYHILPLGSGQWDYGVTIYGGSSMEERREILGRLAGIYISLEGGPGTLHEISVAAANKALVIPVSRTGGCSRDYYRSACGSLAVSDGNWARLDEAGLSIDGLVNAIVSIIQAAPRPPPSTAPRP